MTRLDLIAAARDAAHAAWRDSYELVDAETAAQWSASSVGELLQDEDDVQDTTALRMLANRIAAASARSSRMHDPQSALVHLARATGAVAVAATDITLGKMQVSDTADEVAQELAELVRDLVAASDKLEKFARERF